MRLHRNYRPEEANYLLKCTNGKAKIVYYMRCLLLKDIGNGRSKVVVFGRDGKPQRQDKQTIRYIDSNRIHPIYTVKKNLMEIKSKT